ncbi:MAG: RNA-binding S4 domain-containing protein [Verrucomicrobiota bacterium]
MNCIRPSRPKLAPCLRKFPPASSGIAPPTDSVRADLWLWSVRLHKTRPLAAAACQADHLKRQGKALKPATPLRIGDELRLTKGPLELHLRVEKLLRQRVGAPEAVTCYSDLTPAENREAAAEAHRRAKEQGGERPTKRHRREREQFLQHLRDAEGP